MFADDIRMHRGGSSPFLVDKTMVCVMAMVWLVGAAAALIAFDTFSLAAPDSALDYARRCAVGFAVGAPLALLVSRLLAGRLWSRVLCILVGALTALMFVGIAVNLAGYLAPPGASWQVPALAEDSDSEVVYTLVGIYVDGGYMHPSISMGPIFFWSLFFRLFGPGLLAPLVFNALCMTFATVLCGVICARLVPAASPRRAAFAGALLMAVIPSIPYYGAMFLKEAPVTLGFTLFALSLSELYKGRVSYRSLLAAALGALLIMPLRHHLGYLAGLGAVICFINARVNRLGSRSSAYNGVLALLLIAVAIVGGGQACRSNADFLMLDTSEAEASSATMVHHQAVGDYDSLVGDYYSRPLAGKLLYLPVAAAAQYFPPFPWNYTRDTHLGRFVPVAHLSLLWYLVGGLVLAWFVLCGTRRRRADGLRLWALFWLGCYLAVALMSAGSVARYYLPFMAVCVPLALDVAVNVRRGTLSLRALGLFALVYVVLLAAGLALAYGFLK